MSVPHDRGHIWVLITLLLLLATSFRFKVIRDKPFSVMVTMRLAS